MNNFIGKFIPICNSPWEKTFLVCLGAALYGGIALVMSVSLRSFYWSDVMGNINGNFFVDGTIKHCESAGFSTMLEGWLFWYCLVCFCNVAGLWLLVFS